MPESPVKAMERSCADLLRSGEKPGIALAVSGGSDSMALVAAALELRTSAPPWRALKVLHVDHGIRAESADDALRLERVVGELGFDFARLRIPEAPPERGSLEAWARGRRYELLAEMMREAKLDVLFTAHHADDQAETVGLALMRGAGVLGLGGMPVSRTLAGDLELHRPFLALDRTELARFREKAGLPVIPDRSNQSLQPRRNLLRHLGVMPRSALNRERLIETGRRVRELRGRLDRVVEDLVERGGLELERRFARRAASVGDLGLRDLPFEVARALIERLLREVTEEHLRPSEAALARLCGAKGLAELARDTWVELREGRLRVWRDDAERRFEEQELVIDGAIVKIEDMGSFRAASSAAGFESDWQVQEVAMGGLAGKLRMRSPNRGEKMQPLGMAGRKSVADLLREAGVDPVHRRAWPVVVDELGIVWLVGLRPAERVRVGDESGSGERVWLGFREA